VKTITQKTEQASGIPRLAYTTSETAAALGVKNTTVWRWTKRGLLKPNRASRIPLYPVSEINRFLEGNLAMNTDLVRETVRGVRKSKGIVEGETKFAEIEHFLTPKPLVSGIMEGDVVELVAGPFKGEKARVQKIDESKEEITVELFEATVPIPVTIRGDHVRVLEKEK
jgi:transcription elongation factor Spt5